ncbi:MAG: hypothetical protein NT091_03585 [Candidatus Falkowbacteria bacterium]|nr:hypothetical protein [Candidatus Falkowbacteria bacterium]
MKIINQNLKNNQKGFGLIEVTVSIYILVMGLLSLVSLMNQNLRMQDINKNTIIAAQLAQEGVELVRNIRDNNWLNQSNSNWQQDIIGGLGGGVSMPISIDYNGRSSIKTISDIDDIQAKLYLDSSGYYVNESTGNTPTLFSRMLEKTNPSSEYMEIKATVKWSERGTNHDFKVATRLYNWRYANR